MPLAEQLLHCLVKGAGETEAEAELKSHLRPLAGDVLAFARDPRPCQHCHWPMRGPICPHCGETQAGYEYLH